MLLNLDNGRGVSMQKSKSTHNAAVFYPVQAAPVFVNTAARESRQGKKQKGFTVMKTEGSLCFRYLPFFSL
jgi:hypothetical protein